jgi:hypothetical protein
MCKISLISQVQVLLDRTRVEPEQAATLGAMLEIPFSRGIEEGIDELSIKVGAFGSAEETAWFGSGSDLVPYGLHQ